MLLIWLKKSQIQIAHKTNLLPEGRRKHEGFVSGSSAACNRPTGDNTIRRLSTDNVVCGEKREVKIALDAGHDLMKPQSCEW